MAFPATTVNNGLDAQSLLWNKAVTAGIVNPTGGLSTIDMLCAVVGNMLTDLPGGINVPTISSPFSIGAAAGAATSANTLVKVVTGIADNTATTVLTITVPNAAHGAMVQVTIIGQAGASGAIGAWEDVTSITYNISVARTAGVAMAAVVSTGFGSAAAAVTGAGTMTCVGAITLNGEGVGATNTASFKATIDQSSTSTLHRCLVLATVINSNAAGVTIA